MFSGGSISPPRQPPLKKRVIPRKRSTETKMAGDDSNSSRTVVVEHITAFTGEVPKLSKVNYQEWALEMQLHLEGMEI